MKLNDYKHLKEGDKFINTGTIMNVSWKNNVSFLVEIPIGTIFEVVRVSGYNESTLIHYAYNFDGEIHNAMFMFNSHNADRCVMYLREDNLKTLGI